MTIFIFGRIIHLNIYIQNIFLIVGDQYRFHSADSNRNLPISCESRLLLAVLELGVLSPARPPDTQTPNLWLMCSSVAIVIRSISMSIRCSLSRAVCRSCLTGTKSKGFTDQLKVWKQGCSLKQYADCQFHKIPLSESLQVSWPLLCGRVEVCS